LSQRFPIILFLLLGFSASHHCFGQEGRLESEFKLDIPLEEVDALWDLIKTSYAQDDFSLGDMKLSGLVSVEDFIDTYYDAEDGRFSEMEISLRYRKRFKDQVLLKELVQLKTPFSEDKVVRNEIKFEVDNKKKVNDLMKRHAFLKYIDGSDIERLSHELASFQIRPEEIQESLKLKQERSRVYIKDENQESIATITLDKVNNSSFPFQKYAELELELNELRYTAADQEEKALMTELNENIKSQLLTKFPNLKVDQRSKYRKMKEIIDASQLSMIWRNMSWVFFGGIVFCSIALFVKDQIF